MTTAIRTAILIGVTALVIGSAVGLRCAYAQTPAQREAERVQQLQIDNARRSQEETNRAVRAMTPKGSDDSTARHSGGTSRPSGGGTSRSSGGGDATAICRAHPVRGGERNPLIGQWRSDAPAGDSFTPLFQMMAAPQCQTFQLGLEFRERTFVNIIGEFPVTYGRQGDIWWACFPESAIGVIGFRIKDANHLTTADDPPCRLRRVGSAQVAQATPDRSGIAALAPGAAAAAVASAGAGAVPTAASSASVGGAAVVLLAAGIAAPGSAFSPVAETSFFMLRNSVDVVIANAGIQPAPGVSRLKTWALACESGSPTCRQGMNALLAASATVTKTDARGQGRMPPLPAGTYYVFGVASNNTPLLLWNVKVDLKPGDNAVRLDQRNAVPIN